MFGTALVVGVLRRFVVGAVVGAAVAEVVVGLDAFAFFELPLATPAITTRTITAAVTRTHLRL